MVPSSERRAGSVERVYVVDDDPSIRRSLMRLFRSEGIDVQAFESAEAFLSDAELRAPLCLLLDEKLGGMSGCELVALLESRGLDVPTIFISATHLEDSKHVVLHKPFTADLLFAAIRQMSASADGRKEEA